MGIVWNYSRIVSGKEQNNPSLLGTRQDVHLLLAGEKWAGQGKGMKRSCDLSSLSPFSTENLYHKGCACEHSPGLELHCPTTSGNGLRTVVGKVQIYLGQIRGL